MPQKTGTAAKTVTNAPAVPNKSAAVPTTVKPFSEKPPVPSEVIDLQSDVEEGEYVDAQEDAVEENDENETTAVSSFVGDAPTTAANVQGGVAKDRTPFAEIAVASLPPPPPVATPSASSNNTCVPPAVMPPFANTPGNKSAAAAVASANKYQLPASAPPPPSSLTAATPKPVEPVAPQEESSSDDGDQYEMDSGYDINYCVFLDLKCYCCSGMTVIVIIATQMVMKIAKVQSRKMFQSGPAALL